MIRQGQVYWLDDDEPLGSEPGYRRPWVVLQNDLFNDSGIRSVIAVPCSTNLRRRGTPGFVSLRGGEGGLPADSLAVAAGVSSMPRLEFQQGDYMGQLSKARVREIVGAVLEVIDPRD